VIRFSAALVAVAIGVLIGGIAANELLLVYIAIVMSAVALVALAVGVVLKREEFFGEGQGLAPAMAGAIPVPLVRVGRSYDDKNRPETRATPAPLQRTAVGPGAAFGGNTLAASSQSAVPAETQASRKPWPPTAPDAPPAWTPAAQDEGSGNGAGTGADGRAASAWQSTAPSSGTAWAWAPPSPSVTPGVGAETTPPSWFGRMGEAASADTPATASSPSASGSGWSSGGDTAAPDKADDTAAPDTTTPATAAVAVDEDDDWPTRYSWLDDEPATGEASNDADLDDHSAQLPSAAEPAASGDSGTRDTETLDTVTPEIMVGDLGDANAADNAGADVAAPAVHGDSEGLSLADDVDPGAAEADEAGSEPTAAPAAEAAPGTGLVAVIRGVPRYHEPDCVLIRFMSEGDSQKLSVAQAKELGCTPCAACQPEG
jgi:hypothetical protein